MQSQLPSGTQAVREVAARLEAMIQEGGFQRRPAPLRARSDEAVRVGRPAVASPLFAADQGLVAVSSGERAPRWTPAHAQARDRSLAGTARLMLSTRRHRHFKQQPAPSSRSDWRPRVGACDEAT